MTHNCLFVSDIFFLRALHKAIKRSRSMHTITNRVMKLIFHMEREKVQNEHVRITILFIAKGHVCSFSTRTHERELACVSFFN